MVAEELPCCKKPAARPGRLQSQKTAKDGKEMKNKECLLRQPLFFFFLAKLGVQKIGLAIVRSSFERVALRHFSAIMTAAADSAA